VGACAAAPSALVLKVPIGALVRANGGWAVFRVVDGRARLTPVEAGALTEREAEIRHGVSAGQMIAVFPSDKFRDGVRVEPRKT
jgi:HlyD family secretion protein